MWTRFRSCDRLTDGMVKNDDSDLKIVHYGHPALRQESKRLGRVTQDVEDLVEKMIALMRAARGVGLAANQVGIPWRVAVVEVDDQLTPLIDPKIVSLKGAESADEGCLSLPRLYGSVLRPTEVVVQARDLSGKRFTVTAEGLMARALCHEIDHLNGKLFVDAADENTLYWLVGQSEDGNPITQPTKLKDALKVYMAAWGAND